MVSDKVYEGARSSIALSRVDQVKQFVIERICSGELAAGDRIESVRETTRITGVSHATVAAAFRALSEDGWIVSTPGRGAFVSVNPPLEAHAAPQTKAQIAGQGSPFPRTLAGSLYVVGGMPAPAAQSHHVYEILSGLQSSAAAQNWQVTWCTLQDLPQASSVNNVVGITGSDQVAESLPPDWLSLAPFVYYGLHPGRYDIDAVIPDNVMGARLCTEHLLGLGHRRILFLTGQKPADTPSSSLGSYFSLRAHGYREAMADAGLDDTNVLPWNIRNQQTVAAVRAILADVWERRAHAPTAIQVATDGMAEEVIELAVELGVRVPDDLSVTGFGEWNTSSRCPLQLTTVKYNRHTMGAELVSLLTRRVDGPANGPLKVLLPMELLVHDSTGRPRRD